MTVQQGPVRFCSVSQVTATRGKNDPELGTVVTDGDETYVYCYNAGTTQISVGECATVSGVTGYSVTVSTTTMIDLPVGVVKHATLTTGTYGFLLQKGYGYAKMVPNSGCAAGQLLTIGADGRSTVKSISTDAPSPAYAKVVVATGSAGVAEAYFRLY
jgi:hypothetical protein